MNRYEIHGRLLALRRRVDSILRGDEGPFGDGSDLRDLRDIDGWLHALIEGMESSLDKHGNPVPSPSTERKG